MQPIPQFLMTPLVSPDDQEIVSETVQPPIINITELLPPARVNLTKRHIQNTDPLPPCHKSKQSDAEIKERYCFSYQKKLTKSNSLKHSPRITKEKEPLTQILPTLYQCNVCEKTYKYITWLKRHLLVHTEETPFNCSLCDKTFTFKANLKRHLLVHTGEKPFKCNLCEKTFTISTNLTRHSLIHTGEKPFNCSLCERKFRDPTNLAHHFRTHTGYKPHQCHICAKAFITSTNLKIHIRKHTGEKPYQCRTCAKAYITSAKLKLHIRKHTGEKPFPCTMCEKRFKSSFLLKSHVRIHKKLASQTDSPAVLPGGYSAINEEITTYRHITNGDYQCEACNKIFGSIALLTKHHESHLTKQKVDNQIERLYKCSNCNMQFKQLNSLDIHKKNEHAKTSNKCEICQLTFDSADRLRIHGLFHRKKPGRMEHSPAHEVKSNLTAQDINGSLSIDTASVLEPVCISSSDLTQEDLEKDAPEAESFSSALLTSSVRGPASCVHGYLADDHSYGSRLPTTTVASQSEDSIDQQSSMEVVAIDHSLDKPSVCESNRSTSDTGIRPTYSLLKQGDSTNTPSFTDLLTPIAETGPLPQADPPFTHYRDHSCEVSPEDNAPSHVTHWNLATSALSYKKDICTIGSGVEVRPSTIPEAGFGLFATRSFKKGDIITWVDGRLVYLTGKNRDDFLASYAASSHVVSLNRDMVVSGHKKTAPGIGGGSFANDACHTEFAHNAKFLKHDTPPKIGVFIKCTRDIEPGEEIFVCYGKDYFRRLGSDFGVAPLTGTPAVNAHAKTLSV